MKAEQWGTVIKRLREEQKITVECLCKGLCASSFLYKIEMGTRIPEFFLFELLLQRLGKSVDRLEIILPMAEYNQLLIRDDISRAILEGNYQLAEQKLEQYYEQNDTIGSIHKMYYIRSRAFLEYERKDSCEAVQKLILEALEITGITGIKDRENDENALLSSLEIENLLLYIKVLFDLGDHLKGEILLDKLYQYIKEITDEELRAKVLPKCYCICGDIYCQAKNYEKALELWEEVYQCLRSTADAYYMIPIMKRLMKVYANCSLVQKRIVIQRQMEALNSLYEECHLKYMEKEFLAYQSYQKEIYLEHEIIAKERVSKGISQETLIEGLYSAPETLSRIETGKTSPKGNKIEVMLQRLGIEKHKFNTVAEVDDFQLLEFHSEINKIHMRKDYALLEQKIKEFIQSIDLTKSKNQFLVKRLQSELDYHLQLKPQNEILANFNQLLSKSYNINIKNERVPMKEEIGILTFILAIYREQKRYEEAIEILKNIFQSYEQSKVNIRYHYRSYAVLMEGYTIHLEEKPLLKEAEEKCDEGIKLNLYCGKGGGLGMFLANKATVYEKKGEDYLVCKEMLKKSFYLFDLYMMEKEKNTIKSYYHINYEDSANVY